MVAQVMFGRYSGVVAISAVLTFVILTWPLLREGFVVVLITFAALGSFRVIVAALRKF